MLDISGRLLIQQGCEAQPRVTRHMSQWTESTDNWVKSRFSPSTETVGASPDSSRRILKDLPYKSHSPYYTEKRTSRG